MDTNKMVPISNAINNEASGWKSKERRNNMVKKMVKFLTKQNASNLRQNLPVFVKTIEKFEEAVFTSSNTEAEYNAKIIIKMNEAKAPRPQTQIQADKSNLLPSNIFGSGGDERAGVVKGGDERVGVIKGGGGASKASKDSSRGGEGARGVDGGGGASKANKSSLGGDGEGDGGVEGGSGISKASNGSIGDGEGVRGVEGSGGASKASDGEEARRVEGGDEALKTSTFSLGDYDVARGVKVGSGASKATKGSSGDGEVSRGVKVGGGSSKAPKGFSGEGARGVEGGGGTLKASKGSSGGGESVRGVKGDGGTSKTSNDSLGEDREANIEWQEQVYQKVQTMKTKYFKKLSLLHKGLYAKLQRYASGPPQPKTPPDILKCENLIRSLEIIFSLFKVSKSNIRPGFEENLAKAEMYINSLEKSSSSRSRNSQVEETSGSKPTAQGMGPENSQLARPNFQPNQMHLQDHEVANQFSSSHPQANQVYDEQGDGNAVQEQTSGEITSPVISSYEILASPLLQNCNEEKEVCQDHTALSDDPSPAMQHLINVLTSVSAGALVASCGDIGKVVQLNDDKLTLEPLNGPPIGATDINLEGVFVADSQARLTRRGRFATRERKMKRSINSMPANDSFVQLTRSEKLFSNSTTAQEYLAEEIKEINKKLVDTEVVVDKEKNFPAAAERAIEYGEGLIVKLLFNSVTVNPNPMSNHTSEKKPIIKPLWLHIPTSYPHCSAVILDEMASEISMDLDLSMKAKLKLKLSLQRLSQPLSVKDIATSWSRCAREAICEYAQPRGGGTFTSKYGGWETCLDGDN